MDAVVTHTHTHTWLSVCLHAQALICSGRGAGLSWSPGGKVREKSLLELPEGKQRTKWGCDKKRGEKKHLCQADVSQKTHEMIKMTLLRINETYLKFISLYSVETAEEKNLTNKL